MNVADYGEYVNTWRASELIKKVLSYRYKTILEYTKD